MKYTGIVEKKKIEHNLAKFIAGDNLIHLARGLVAGIILLEKNDAIELLNKLDPKIEVKIKNGKKV